MWRRVVSCRIMSCFANLQSEDLENQFDGKKGRPCNLQKESGSERNFSKAQEFVIDCVYPCALLVPFDSQCVRTLVICG